MVKVALFGGTGGCGSAFADCALEANHSVVLLVRTPSKVEITHDNLNVIEGDGTSAEDVKKAVEGCDVVVSCVGGHGIMKAVATNIISACDMHDITRCYFVTSLGMGGSSPTVRFVLGCVVGFANIADYDAADKKILDAGFTTVRPTGLTEKREPAGKYLATNETGMGMGELHKKDVARFICDEIEKNEWPGKPVQLYKAK